MTKLHVNHTDIARFADERINLKQENATVLRKQAQNLREKLKSHIAEHPDFVLRKIMLSGSLAKGTALKSTSDIDMAIYVSVDDVPNVDDIAEWLAEKLRELYPQMSHGQIKPQRYSVCVSFSGTGLDIDIVPILYDGDPQWRGNLVSQHDGSLLMTSIPMHLEFIRARKTKTDRHYAQLIRLIKFWAKRKKLENSNFRCKSFLVELIVAHLFDHNRLTIDDYPLALKQFFDEIASGLLDEPIIFSDYYKPDSVPKLDDIVKVFDPVNQMNNVALDYDRANLNCLVDAALIAGDAIEAAHYAPTKHEAVNYWQEILGNTFKV